MKISQKGIDFIISHEGFTSKPYWDVNGLAIGHGSHYNVDGSPIRSNQIIDKSEARKMLVAHCERSAYPVLKDLNINQNQFDALCSFIYNIGDVAFKNSTIRQMIANDPNDKNILTEFMKWTLVKDKNGVRKRNLTLVKIRTNEANMYFSNVPFNFLTLSMVAFAGIYFYYKNKYYT